MKFISEIFVYNSLTVKENSYRKLIHVLKLISEVGYERS